MRCSHDCKRARFTEKCLSLIVIPTGRKHERSLYAPPFGQRPTEWNKDQEPSEQKVTTMTTKKVFFRSCVPMQAHSLSILSRKGHSLTRSWPFVATLENSTIQPSGEKHNGKGIAVGGTYATTTWEMDCAELIPKPYTRATYSSPSAEPQSCVDASPSARLGLVSCQMLF